MRELFGCEENLSDRTMGVSVAGVALGATVIEKHSTPQPHGWWCGQRLFHGTCRTEPVEDYLDNACCAAKMGEKLAHEDHDRVIEALYKILS